MIAFLRGNIIYSDIEKSLVILDVQGVGYEIFLPVNQMYFTQFSVQQNYNDNHNTNNNYGSNSYLNQSASFFIYTYVREDRIVLYGFPNFTQRELFSILLDTKDIGPKLAVTILSNIKADDFINLILTKNITGLSSIKGIGTLTAERIVSGLKNKIVKRFNSFKDVEAASIGSVTNIANSSYDYDINGSGKNRDSGVDIGVASGITIANINNNADKKNIENSNSLNNGHNDDSLDEDLNLNNSLGFGNSSLVPGDNNSNSTAKNFNNNNNNNNKNNNDHRDNYNNNKGNSAGKNIIYETALALNALGYSMADSIELASCASKDMQEIRRQSQIADVKAETVNICEINTENLLKECLKHIYKNKISS